MSHLRPNYIVYNYAISVFCTGSTLLTLRQTRKSNGRFILYCKDNCLLQQSNYTYVYDANAVIYRFWSAHWQLVEQDNRRLLCVAVTAS